MLLVHRRQNVTLYLYKRAFCAMAGFIGGLKWLVQLVLVNMFVCFDTAFSISFDKNDNFDTGP